MSREDAKLLGWCTEVFSRSLDGLVRDIGVEYSFEVPKRVKFVLLHSSPSPCLAITPASVDSALASVSLLPLALEATLDPFVTSASSFAKPTEFVALYRQGEF